MDSPHLDEALRFKTNSLRGGNIENIYAVNINVNQVKNAVLKIDYYYEEGGCWKISSIYKKNVYLKKMLSLWKVVMECG